MEIMKKYKVNKTVGNSNIFVTIRLDDECKNGHNDFSITANIYEKGKPKIDRYHIAGGCCHKEILKAFPEFKIFVDLHLCDFNGAPMYASSNGFYHAKNSHKEVFKKYMRVTDNEADILMTATGENHFMYLMHTLYLVDRWKKEAEKAIELLEKLTGEKFVNYENSKGHFELSQKLITKYARLTREGFFTPEKIAARKEQKKVEDSIKLRNEIIEAKNKAILLIENETKIKLEMLDCGFSSIRNYTYYESTNTLTFNQFSFYDRISNDTYIEILTKLNIDNLPKGIQFNIKS